MEEAWTSSQSIERSFGVWRMEDTMAEGVVNESLVTKQQEDFSESGTIDTLLNSGDIDTRTGLLNSLVICFKTHGQKSNVNKMRWLFLTNLSRISFEAPP